MEARDKIRRGLDYIFDDHPYAASIAASWKISEDPIRSMGTCSTDGPNLYYKKEFIEILSIREVCDLMLHEVMHILLGHHFRFSGKGPRKWNVAGDLALNDLVKEYYDPKGLIFQEGLFPGEDYRRKPHIDPKTGVDLGKRFVHYPQGETAEKYFELYSSELQDEKAKKEEKLQNQKAQNQKPQKGRGVQMPESPSMEDEEDLPEDPDGDQQEREGERSSQGARSDKTAEEKTDASSGEDESDVPETPGEVLPHPAATEEDGEKNEEKNEEKLAEAKEEWEQQVAEGVNQAKKMGNAPGWLKDLVHEYDHTIPIDPEALLRQFMTQYAPTSTSYAKPNRRSAWRSDVVLPAQHARDLSPGYVLTDTSRSMTEKEMNAALALIERTVKVFPNCTITLGQSDTRLIAESTRKFTRFDFPLRIPHEWMGRGGTDLSPAISEIGKSKKYEWLVIISDMEWRVDKAVNPQMPVLWLTTTGAPEGYRKPKFGQVVPMEIGHQ